MGVSTQSTGVKEDDEASALNDEFRVNYFQMYIAQVHEAIQEGADVRGYFAWSMLDNFEWSLGYSKRFGIVRVDYETQRRTPKASAKLISAIARDNCLTVSADIVRASQKSQMALPSLLGGSAQSDVKSSTPRAETLVQ